MVTNFVRTYALLFQNVIEPLQALGHEIVWAANFTNFVGDRSLIPCKTIHIDIQSYPFHRSNLKAYREIKKIIVSEEIEGLQCSTPIGSTLARIAAWRCGLKHVVYTAHGFLFFEGAPLINRTIYKLPEILLAHVTDALITINETDYRAAKHFSLRGGKEPYLIHGAGVKVGVKVDVDKIQKRLTLGLSESDVVVVSAGDLNANKNNKVIIEAFSEIRNKKVHYLICGTGTLENDLKSLVAELGLKDNVHFLGYRTDMSEILASSDIFVMPSFREGVPRSIMEAMDLKLPCVGSRTRGIADLIDDNKGGFLCKADSPKEFADAITKLTDDVDLRSKFGEYNKIKVQGYSSDIVRSELTKIYSEVFK